MRDPLQPQTTSFLGVHLKRLLTGATLLLVSIFGCSGREAPRDRGAPESVQTVLPLDPGKVPEDLRDLVPLAQRWGIGDDVARAERVRTATDAERAELRAAFGSQQARTTAWLDSFGQGPMPEEAAAFMYTQLAIEEMP
jgi:hypothetical protein